MSLKYVAEKKELLAFLIAFGLVCFLLGVVLSGGSTDITYDNLAVSIGGEEGSGGDRRCIPASEAIAAIYEKTEDMSQTVDYLMGYTARDIVRNIEIQFIAIQEDPKQIRVPDIIKCLDDWESLPCDRKNADLKIKYNYILEFYRKSLDQQGLFADIEGGNV